MNSATQSFLGRYRLVKVLGQGAMGVVYEAVDTRLNRTVAIKTVLRSHMADETTANEYATRFEREAQAAARLTNPHVVAVYDFGEHEDISYIVMEFVRGRELNQAFEANETFALPEVIRIMRELLEALDYAHREGIVHRDVKPANVMLDAGGRVKLTDFGVARVANANQDRTMPGTLVGTPSYMSPEQILGLAVGSRADIFAAGVILYQFLTGKRPFSGGGPFGVQRKIVQDDPDPPSQVNPKLPPGFDLIIARALAKQPEDRYETAAAFAADLERIGTTLPRDLPRIDLDFSDSRPAPAPAPTLPAPAPSPAPEAAQGLKLIPEQPFGAPPTARAPAPEPVGPPVDPEATVIMFRPTAPDIARKPPAPPPTGSTGPAPAALPPRPAPMPPPPAPAPKSMPPTAAQLAAAANPPTMAVPRLQQGATVQRSHQPPGRGAGAPTAAAGHAGAQSPTRSTQMPLAAGAGVAVLVLAGWLLVARPWAAKPAAEASSPATNGTSTSTTSTNPATPAAEPSPAPSPSPSPAPMPAPVPAPAPAEAAPVTAPTSMPTAPPTDVAPAAQATPPARPAPASAAPTRRPQAEAAPKPPPAARTEPRSALEPRCSDLLQRMQLGEPLTADQTMFFQSRCTR